MMNNQDFQMPIPITRNRYKAPELRIQETDQYISDYYSSGDYHSRLNAIKGMLACSQGKISLDVIHDGLNDFCSVVRQHILQNFDFKEMKDSKIESTLMQIAIHDEKALIRVLALNKLAAINASSYHDLFFSTSLLKSNKEAAAGLRGLLKTDPGKAYTMAKFRIPTSGGELDLAITEVLASQNKIEDLNVCKQFLINRKKFFKTRYTPSYFRLLTRIAKPPLVRHHLDFICENIRSTGNQAVVSVLIQQLFTLARDINHPGNELFQFKNDLEPFVNSLIDQLLGASVLKKAYSA